MKAAASKANNNAADIEAAAVAADEYDADAIMREILGDKSLTLSSIVFSDDDELTAHLPTLLAGECCCAIALLFY